MSNRCFADGYQISDWALEALCRAAENGVINGKGGDILDPAGAETAQMLKNFLGNQ